MTAYEFSQPWLDELHGKQANTAKEFGHLRSYLAGLDNGTIPLFNLRLLNSTITNLTVGGNIAMGGFKLTGLGAGSSNGDSLRYEQLIGVYLPLAGGTMAGNIAMGSNKLTGLAAGTSNGDSVRFEQLNTGKILQIVSAAGFAGNTITSSTYTDITGATATITPTSTSSKILVLFCINYGTNAAAKQTSMTLDQGGNLFDASDGWGRKVSDAANTAHSEVLIYLHSPASVSALTYKVQARSHDNVSGIFAGNFSGAGGNNLYLLEMGQ